MGTRSKILKLKTDVSKLDVKTNEVVKKLNELADEVDKIFDAVKKSKIAGATAAIVGGLIAGTGFVLSFFTFGASFALVAAGAAVGTAGSLTVAISETVNAIKSSSKWTEAQSALMEYESLRKEIKEACLEIGEDLGRIGNVDLDFETYVDLVANLMYGATKVGKTVVWNMIATPIRVSLQFVKGVRMGGAKAGVSAARVASGTVTHVAGGVFGLLMIPIDIYTLVDSAIDLHKNNPHQVAVDIRNAAKKLSENRLTKDVIEKQFQGILEQLSLKTQKKH